jgi:dihydropteroate synthase
MGFAPRLLWVEDEAAAGQLLQALGADPAGVTRMAAKMVRRLVHLTAVPCRAANVLKQEMLALGGDAAVARGTVACAIAVTDVVLIGSLKQLRQLCERLPQQPFGLRELAAELVDLLAAIDRLPRQLLGRNCALDLDRPRIMGVLNVTPDSFSDGGRYQGPEAALRRALEMVREGADLIDIGGESTRPGAPAVSAEEELERVVPVVELLQRELDLPLSIDTSKASVARGAIAAGAHFINDISGLTFDPEIASVAAASGAGLFLMHTPGRPEQMQRQTRYTDLLGEVMAFLARSLARAEAAGVASSKLAVDPGIGFGKDAAGNLLLLQRLRELQSLGRPVLLGTSRKSFIGKVLGQADPGERLFGTLATVALGVERGAQIFRVHDVRAAREAALLAWAIGQGGAALV